MQDSRTAPEVRVCAATNLVNGGLGVKVPVSDRAGRATAFFVRYQDQVHGYLNRCAHVGVELDGKAAFSPAPGAGLGITVQPSHLSPPQPACRPCRGWNSPSSRPPRPTSRPGH